MPIFVFDIETIPDISQGRKLYNLSDDLNADDCAKAMYALRRAKTGNDFLPHYLQQIVAISIVLYNGDYLKVWSLGELDSTEDELIKRFYSGIDKHTPVLVSWNGCGFDLPVLHYRALLHKIQAPSYWEAGDNNRDFRWNNYLSRFHYRHLDLMDVLAGYQNKAYAPLDDIASILGFPGKMGMSGDKVWQEYQSGNLEGIRNYCETDVLNTFCVYLRFELMRGLIKEEDYNLAIEQLKNYLNKENKSHFKEFLGNIVV